MHYRSSCIINFAWTWVCHDTAPRANSYSHAACKSLQLRFIVDSCLDMDNGIDHKSCTPVRCVCLQDMFLLMSSGVSLLFWTMIVAAYVSSWVHVRFHEIVKHRASIPCRDVLCYFFFTSGLIIGCILCVFDIFVWVQADEALRRLFKSDFA